MIYIYIYTYIIFTYTHNIQHKIYIIQSTHVQSIASCPFTGSSLLYGSQQLQLIWKNKHVQWLNPHVGWLSIFLHMTSTLVHPDMMIIGILICIYDMYMSHVFMAYGFYPEKRNKRTSDTATAPAFGRLVNSILLT